MSNRFLKFLFIILFAVLCVICILTYANKIEDNLQTEVKNQHKSEGISWANVKSSGRDITITGSSPNKAQQKRAIELASSVFGVSSVNNKSSVNNLATDTRKINAINAVKIEPKLKEIPKITGKIKLPKPASIEIAQNIESDTNQIAANTNYKFAIKINSKEVHLTGDIPNTETRTALLAFIKANYKDSRKIIDDTFNNTNYPEDWNKALSAATSFLGFFKNNANASIENNIISIQGEMEDARVYAKIKRKIRENVRNNYGIKYDIKLPSIVANNAKNCQNKIDDILSEKEITFLGKELTKKARTTIAELAKEIKKCKIEAISIIGKSPNKTDEDQLLETSKSRASKVAALLVEEGLEPSLIVPSGSFDTNDNKQIHILTEGY